MRVLFPTDGSEQTEAALGLALEMLADHADLALTIFNVQQEGFEGADPDVASEVDANERDELFPSKEASQRAIDRCVAICADHGVEPATKIVAGRYTKEILAEAAHHDVLVMHGLGSSSLRDTLGGSRSESLARKAPCSVLLVRTAHD